MNLYANSLNMAKDRLLNLSTVDDETTARTCQEAADQRAENLAILGIKQVMELCVGPSYSTLQSAYAKRGISLIGNDIDDRWKRYANREGTLDSCTWRHGDCLTVPWNGTDAVVFAPPLTKNCTGRRSDALRINEIRPSYDHFLDEWNLRYRQIILDGQSATPGLFPRTAVLVLPARSLAVSRDRHQLYGLVRFASYFGNTEVYPVYCGRRKILKYVDIYVTRY